MYEFPFIYASLDLKRKKQHNFSGIFQSVINKLYFIIGAPEILIFLFLDGALILIQYGVPRFIILPIHFSDFGRGTMFPYNSGAHGRSQDFFRGGGHFFKKILKKNRKKIIKNMQKN